MLKEHHHQRKSCKNCLFLLLQISILKNTAAFFFFSYQLIKHKRTKQELIKAQNPCFDKNPGNRWNCDIFIKNCNVCASLHSFLIFSHGFKKGLFTENGLSKYLYKITCLLPFNIFSSAFLNWAFDVGLHMYQSHESTISILLNVKYDILVSLMSVKASTWNYIVFIDSWNVKLNTSLILYLNTIQQY